jgi:hypothetical protein
VPDENELRGCLHDHVGKRAARLRWLRTLFGPKRARVSFALALWTALEARAVVFTQTPQLLRALGRRLRTVPGIFQRPPRGQ